MAENNKLIEKLIVDINKIAMSYDECDYGLPIHDDDNISEIRASIQAVIEKEKQVFMSAIRSAIADYMHTEGCSCCRDAEGHKKNKKRLATLLNVPAFSDESGYDFSTFRSDK